MTGWRMHWHCYCLYSICLNDFPRFLPTNRGISFLSGGKVYKACIRSVPLLVSETWPKPTGYQGRLKLKWKDMVNSCVTYMKNIWALAWRKIDWNGEMLSDQWHSRLDSNALWLENEYEMTSKYKRHLLVASHKTWLCLIHLWKNLVESFLS